MDSPLVNAPILDKMLRRPLVRGFNKRTYQERIAQIGGANLINYLPLTDAVAGGTAVDPVTSRNWTYGASNVSAGAGMDSVSGLSAAQFGGAAAGQVVPTAGTLAALNTGGVFNPLEGTLAIWLQVSAANMANATIYFFAEFGVDSSNHFRLFKPSANVITARWALGGTLNGVNIAYSGGTIFVHFAETWSQNANSLIAYLNGVQQGSTLPYSGIWVGALNANFTQLASVNNTGYLPGSLSDMLLANRALAPGEIAGLA